MTAIQDLSELKMLIHLTDTKNIKQAMIFGGLFKNLDEGKFYPKYI